MSMVTSMNPSKEAGSINPLQVLSLVRSASGALFAQASLYAQLAQVEWQEEKQRLSKILILALLGFAFFLCLLFFMGGLVLTLTWETQYRIEAFIGLIFFYLVAFIAIGFKIFKLSQQNVNSFAGTRAEIAADIALIKSAL